MLQSKGIQYEKIVYYMSPTTRITLWKSKNFADSKSGCQRLGRQDNE